MTDFAPRDTSTDVSNVFMKFCQHASKGKGKGAMVGGPIVPLSAPQAANPGINNFLATWGLNEDSRGVLLALTPDCQLRVMQQFAPKDTSRDVNNVFMKFAQSLGQAACGMAAGFPGAARAQQPFQTAGAT